MYIGDGTQLELFPVQFYARTDATTTTVLLGRVDLAEQPKSFVQMVCDSEQRMRRES